MNNEKINIASIVLSRAREEENKTVEERKENKEKIKEMNKNESFDIFISYNWGIKEDVIKLEENLKKKNYSVWRDDYELRAGENLDSRLVEAITHSKLIVCCITQDYCMSKNCNLEFYYATSINKPLVCLMIQDIKPTEIYKLKLKADGSSCGIGFKLESLVRTNSFRDGNNWPNECIKAIEDKIKRRTNIGTFNNNNETNETLQSNNVIGHKSFTGRENELKKIEESFLNNQYVYVIGRSGYGKTTLAKEFASRIKEKQNHIIKWIESENLIFSFKMIAEELEMGLDDKIKSEELIEKVKNKLNRFTKEKNLQLIIFIDNLIYNKKDETLNDYRYLINNFNSNIKFLITTKNQSILDELNKHKSIKIELQTFNREDCFKFIEKNLNKIQQNNFKKEDWKKIFNIMNPINEGNSILPIRLDKLISKINENRVWNYKRVENYIKNNEENSFELLKQEYPKAFEILSYLAFLKGNSISLKLIANILIDEILVEKQKEIIEDDLNSSLKFLENNSEIMINDKTYSIHETTQNDVLKIIGNQLEIKNKTMKVLDNLIYYDAKENNKFKLEENEEEYFNHLSKILQETERDNLDKNHLNILKKVAGIYNNILTKYDKAKEYYVLDLEISLKTLHKNDPDLATSYNNLGEVYNNKAEYNKAIEYYNQSLNIQKILLPENHPDLAKTYNNIGLVYYDKGEYDKALEYYNKSLNIQKISLPENHPDLAKTYNNKGEVYNNKGEYDKALKYYNQSLDIRKISLLGNHPDLALSYSNIGLVYDNKGKYEKAIEYYQQSLNIRKLSLPDNHPHLATSYNNIGGVYYNKGEIDRAIEYFNQSLNIRKKTLPKNHPDIAGSFNNIGLVYYNKGEYDKAIEYYKRSLNIRKISLPENHPDLATSYNNISLVYNDKEEYDKALEYYNKSLNIQKISLPDNHPHIATSYSNIGLVYDNKGEYDKALKYYNQSLNIQTISLSKNHPDLARTYNTIGLVYYNKGKYEKALEYYKQSLNIRKISLPDNHPDLASSYSNVGLVYDDKGQFKKAIKYYKQSLNIMEISMPNTTTLIQSIKRCKKFESENSRLYSSATTSLAASSRQLNTFNFPTNQAYGYNPNYANNYGYSNNYNYNYNYTSNYSYPNNYYNTPKLSQY